ncbi:MAG: tripartite tricarboxylate transporter substrate binding protein [Acidobacteria bacterium]|nr:tripartite tricarboxylate transporter substrate binding protein [Acidobacteriota bacterium]MYJ06081.1 tripartite tricarboxylate transporter substrate binding protein [Acidobacteriota bacterium]
MIRARGRRPLVAAACLLVALAVTACAGGSGPGVARAGQALAPTAAGFPDGPITIIAPANPGGGWDQTARQIQQVWTEAGILGVPVEVVNRGGAGGAIGLAELVTTHRDDARTLMVFGQVMLGALRTNDSPVSVGETVPIARLLNEYQMVTVPADSDYGTLGELMDDFRRDPAAMAWAGGSAGGIDHILAGLLAQAAGADPRLVNYIAYAGGGEAAAAVMGGHVAAGISGFGEWKAYVESGRMRPLAVSAPERIEGDATPTLQESGFDVVVSNWRGLTAPPGTDEETRDWLIRAAEQMRMSPQWREILRANDWEDSFLPGAAFEDFLREETATVDATLRAIGLIQ